MFGKNLRLLIKILQVEFWSFIIKTIRHGDPLSTNSKSYHKCFFIQNLLENKFSFSYEICTVLVITLFNFYKLNKRQKMSDLLHHIYPSKWANCSKNHQQQATKTYLLLVHYCSYGLYVNTSVCITLQVSSDIYLFSSSN